MQRLLFCALLLVPISSSVAQEKKPDAAGQPVPEALGGSTEKATLVLNPSGHVHAIQGVFFRPDGKQLVSVGVDRTVQFWDVVTGERVKILRLPATPTAAALSPDGRTLALGRAGNKGDRRILLLNLDDERLLWLSCKDDREGSVSALAFSHTGEMLAAGRVDAKGTKGAKAANGAYLWNGLREIWKKTPQEVVSLEGRLVALVPRISRLAFSPDGKRLALGCNPQKGSAQVVDLPTGNARPTPPLALGIGSRITGIAWSPDGTQVVTTDQNYSPVSTVRFYSATNGQLLRQHKLGWLDGSGLHFLNDQQLLLTWYNDGSDRKSKGGGLPALGHGQSVLSLAEPIQARRGPYLTGAPDAGTCRSALSPDGKLAAFTGGRMMEEIVVWEPATGKQIHHLGGKLGTPQTVGWSKDGKRLAFDTVEDRGTKKDRRPFFESALDLESLELRQKVERSDYHYRYRTNGDWSLKPARDFGYQNLLHQDQLVRGMIGTGWNISSGGIYIYVAGTLSPAPEPKWVAYRMGKEVELAELPGGKRVQTLLPHRQRVFDLAPSPDARYLISVNDQQVAFIYRIADDPAKTDPQPLLHLFLSHGDWILWTKEGYYAASPNGERLMGWTVDNGPSKLPSFYSAERFRKALYRPELIKKVLELGSVSAALKNLAGDKAKTADLDQFLPPKCTLQILKEEGQQVTVQVNAAAQVKNQPVVAVRLLLDGRPLPEEEGYREFDPGQPEVSRPFTLTLPPGQHSLAVLARSQDASALSGTVTVGQVVAVQQPVLHLVAIGIDNYGNGIPKLNCAVNDARDLAKAFPLVKQGNLFRDVQTQLLDNQKATVKGIRAQLANLRPNLKHDDVLVLFFAGHGVREGKEFYLLTAEANLNDLARTALSGRELSRLLRDLPCQVLLLLDACHSGAVARNLRPATDDAARTFADDEVGVIVLTAALGHQPALEKNGNGYFTLALKQALAGEGKIFFSERDGRMYVHHLYSVVLDRVADWSAQRQHPYLSLPSTALPLALRQFRP